MELQCQLLLYLDKRRYLADMKTECEKFLQEQVNRINKFPPLRFLLKIDVMDLLDTFASVGMYVIQEPLKWQRMCSEILFACLKSTAGEQNQNIRQDQCLALVRLQSLSKLLIPPNKQHYSGLVLFEGILISISNPTSYVHHTVWCCPEECEGSEVVLHYIPKAPPKCYICRSVLFENSGFRRCGEQVIATFKLERYSKNLSISDDLIPKLTLGLKYSIHAVVLKKLTAVWSLEEIIPLSTPLTCPILKDIEVLYKYCDGLPWKFVYCLAGTIGVNVCPRNCFMHLKISLLISLCSVKARLQTKSEIVHVLAAGCDTGYVGKLMTEASKVADRSIFLGTCNATVSTSLLASSGGVCVLPLPLHAYNQKQTCGVLAAVESGEVTTETSKTKLRSAVWAQGMDFKKIVLYNVASVFGSVCRGDYCEFNEEINDFILERAIDPVESNSQELQELKELASYIDLVAGIKVSLNFTTENLLKKYFLAARKERSSAVAVGSMRALVATCMTSARLCRRSVANIDDAVLAIWLHESGSPEPRLAPEECLQTPANFKKLHNKLNTFKEWLEQFTGSIIFN
ncbi:Uncharacterized protein OBRU01_14771 [Operophtera brumata]|uniref:MCMDC2 N-terminal domain-containing protein n=1 Tax=Operophtera brumata TaxID=104452 RepID=A0A0L7L655_OPEBR|nr:Uncharacterized protein OBRU01_14771 [Operophtera brumata]